MKTKTIIFFLFYFSSFVFVILSIATVLFLVTSVINMQEKNKSGFESTSIDLCAISIYDEGSSNVDFTYSQDNTIRYKPIIKEYTVQVKPNTPLAYYFILFQLIYLGLGVTFSWFSLKFFKDLKLEKPFKFRLIKYLKIIAVLFISADILKFINNLIFNQFIHQSALQSGFQFPHTIFLVSNGIFLGLFIWIIAIIFQRGVELQTENELTV